MSSSTRRLYRAAVTCAAITALALVGACGKDDKNGGGQRTLDSAGLAAEVGDARITTDDLTAAVDAATKSGKSQLPPDELTRRLLSLKLQLAIFKQQAARLGATVGQAEFDKIRADAGKEEAIASAGGLDAYLASQGLGAKEVVEVIELEAYTQAVRTKILADVPVTEAQLKKLYDEHKAELETVHSAHILVKEEKLAKQILADVKDGGDFAELAKKHSIDPGSKDRGGDLGDSPRGKFVPEFDKAVFAGKPGDVVGPVKTQFGYHIIKIIDRATYESVKDQLRQRAGQEGVKAEIDRERAAALAASGGVRVNPRFGRWDDATLSVVAVESTDDPSSPSPGPSAPVTGDPTESVSPTP